jgi:hypothetical protein
MSTGTQKSVNIVTPGCCFLLTTQKEFCFKITQSYLHKFGHCVFNSKVFFSDILIFREKKTQPIFNTVAKVVFKFSETVLCTRSTKLVNCGFFP